MVATLLMCLSVYVTWKLFLFAVKSPETEIIVRKTSATDRDVLLAGLRRRNNKERDRKMIAAGGREAGGAVCYMLQWVKCQTVLLIILSLARCRNDMLRVTIYSQSVRMTWSTRLTQGLSSDKKLCR